VKDSPQVATNQAKVLVTGATGFLGERLVKRLVNEGYGVRALARKTSNIEVLNRYGVETVWGDLGDKSSVVGAAKGIEILVHAAAGTSGTARDSEIATIDGTRNVLEACRINCVKKLIYISSCSVYEVAGYAENQVVTEEAQIERFSQRRGRYSAAKLQAEALVTEVLNRDGYSTVVLRPGTFYGPGAEVYTPMIGISLARRVFVIFGDGGGGLPLVYVDNVVDSIIQCITNNTADNQVFNVVDRDPVTKKMYIEQIVKPIYPKAMVIYCPMSLLLLVAWIQEKLFAIIRKQPVHSLYRLRSSQNCVRYSTGKIKNMIGWQSHITFEQGAEQVRMWHKRPAVPDSEL
jgi:2-alkyl-3-oxoalkanoate reductase